MANCSDCAAWQQMSEGSTLGLCRRHAPQLYGGGFTMWPQTRSQAWCGDHVAVSIENAASGPVQSEPFIGPITAPGELDPEPKPSVVDRLKAWLSR